MVVGAVRFRRHTNNQTNDHQQPTTNNQKPITKNYALSCQIEKFSALANVTQAM